MKRRLILIDSGPIFSLAEQTLKHYSLSPAQTETYLELLAHWLQHTGWCPMLADLPGEPARNLVVLCVDSKPYWRNEIYPEYKAARPQKSALYEVIRDGLISRLNAAIVPGYEADDLIAHLVRRWEGRATQSPIAECFIATVDRDLMGLLDGGAQWLRLTDQGQRVWGTNDLFCWMAQEYPKAGKLRQKWWAMPCRKEFRATDIWQWKAIVTGDSSDRILYPRAKRAELQPELIELFKGLIDLDNPIQALPGGGWADSALLRGMGWEPTEDYREALVEMGTMGLTPPVVPLPLVPSMLASALNG